MNLDDTHNTIGAPVASSHRNGRDSTCSESKGVFPRSRFAAMRRRTAGSAIFDWGSRGGRFFLVLACLLWGNATGAGIVRNSTQDRSQPGDAPFRFRSVQKVPLSSVKLGDAALIAPETMRRLGLEPGREIELSSGDRRVRVLAYPIRRDPDSISLPPDVRKRLGVQPGDDADVGLWIVPADQRTLVSPVAEVRIESHPTDSENWPGLVIGAPHGDSDLYTGEIVEAVARQFGVGGVAVYGSRVPYVGRWIDANRPLQRRPDPETLGIRPNRDWTVEAVEVYNRFRSRVIASGRDSESDQGGDANSGSVPLRLYIDFHGHDLTVTDSDGKKIYRNVFECVGRGFDSSEVRELKAILDRCVRDEFGSEAPASHWGNLPEDQRYEFQGIETRFFYNALGARTYGILASDIAHRAIHIESPNLMRLEKENRERTVRVLDRFAQTVYRELLPRSLQRQSAAPDVGQPPDRDRWVRVDAGEFLMGAPDEEEWSLEHPLHRVQLGPYQIDRYETTCGEFARFLNRQLASGRIALDGGWIRDATTGHVWCRIFPCGPLAMLQERDGQIVPRAGRAHHPVTYVSWYGAQAFANAQGGRLPSEAEWERAAAWDAKTGRPYRTSIGIPRYRFPVPATLTNGGSPSQNVRAPSTTPVGHYRLTSPTGCFDMAGNVWEWTGDWFGPYPDDNEVPRDPSGPDSGTMKTIRGGAWDCEPFVATPTYRIAVDPEQTLPNLGFRIVKPAD